jgi:benzoyl-CoA reductase/2-hydroxyglutaryl-CoA dehydratase subunit BcrC/BadD/HgdB
MAMDDKVYTDFLHLAAFDESEIPTLMPGWRNAAEKLGLTKDDIEYATYEWIPQNWDTTSLGERKVLGAYTREIIDLCQTPKYKKQGTKIVYGILPAQTICYYGIKNAGGDNVYVSFPDIAIVYWINGFLHKIDPFLEAAETEGGVVYGCRHCALNKTRIAARMKGIIPDPDITWTWGFNCDEGPKTDEYINCYIAPGWNFEVTRIPHDTHFGEADDLNVERIEYLAAQLKLSLDNVQEAIGIPITPEAMNQAVKDWGRIAMKLANLERLTFKPDPVTLDGSALHLAGAVTGVPFNTGFGYMEEAIDIMTKEAIQRAKQGIGIAPKGSPKLGSYFVPAAVPWVNSVFKENGVAMTFSLVTSMSERLLKPPSYEDPYLASAETWLRMSIGMNLGLEVDDTVQKVQALKPDAMVMGFFDFDRWLGAHQKIMSKLVEERTGVPHFYLECDFWEDRDYSQEALRTRIESISQVIKMHKMEQSSELVPA